MFMCEEVGSGDLSSMFSWMKLNSVHFFVAIPALSIFIQCDFFSEGEKKIERKSHCNKKMHGVPFHRFLSGRIYNIRTSFSWERARESKGERERERKREGGK